MIVLQDFCFMRQGKCLENLDTDKAYLLAPVAVRRQTSGRALFLIHGFASSPAVYRELIPHLSHYDAIFCPVLPGHGQSFADFSRVKASAWLDFVEQQFDSIATDYEHIDIMGLSLGGLLACHLAKTKTIRHLYLLAPALSLKKSLFLSSGFVQLLMSFHFTSLRNRGGGVLNPVNHELTFRRMPLTAVYQIFHLIETFQLTPLHPPTTLFLGRYDDVIHNKKVEAKIRTASLNLEIIYLDHSAHVLPLDYDLETIIRKT